MPKRVCVFVSRVYLVVWLWVRVPGCVNNCVFVCLCARLFVWLCGCVFVRPLAYYCVWLCVVACMYVRMCVLVCVRGYV